MLKRKDIWDEIQMSQATRKARDLSRADTVKTTVGKRNGSAADAFKKEYGKDSVPAGYDVDHVIDLQLGSADHVSNMRPLDASVNRIAAWVIGMRNMQKALLYALLEPVSTLQKAEEEGDFTKRIMLLEELKSMPWESVWDYYCEKQGVPVGIAWMEEVLRYEKEELAGRKVR